MNLGIVADEIDRDFSRALAVGTSLGLRRYEIRFLKSGRAPMCDRQEMLDVERLAKDAGVDITALSPGLFKYAIDETSFRRDLDEVYPQAAEWAHRWKLPGLIVFGFQKPGATEENGDTISSANPPERIVEWLAEAGTHAKADGLLLMIEPEPICWIDTSTAAAALIRRAGVPSLRINYDPGNAAWMLRRDPIDEFAVAASLISNVHIKNVLPSAIGSGKPKFAPADEGIIEFAAHFRALAEAGYTGPISLEPHMSGEAEVVRRCRDAVLAIARDAGIKVEPEST